VSFVEPRVIKDADEVITVSDGIASEYKRLFGLREISVILNAPHKQEVRAVDLFREKFSIGKTKKIFLYQGGLSKGRGIELLIASFERLADAKSDAVLILMGYGDLTSMVKAAAGRLSNVHFHPAVPYNRIVDHSSSADFGILSTENTCLNHFYCMPNKMFEYIQSGLPIITTNLNDCRKLIVKEGIGLVISEFTVDGVIETIERAMKMDPRVFDEALAAAKEKYHWDIEEKKLLTIYNRL